VEARHEMESHMMGFYAGRELFAIDKRCGGELGSNNTNVAVVVPWIRVVTCFVVEEDKRCHVYDEYNVRIPGELLDAVKVTQK